MASYTGAGLCQVAMTYIGTPYSTLDCSKFVRAAIKKYCGKDIGSNCKSQIANFRSKYPSLVKECGGGTVNKKNVKAGDLIYKMNYDGGSQHHVMISDGKGGVIESSGGYGSVRYKSPYSWAYKGVTAIVRLFEPGGPVSITPPSGGGGSSSIGSSSGSTPSEGNTDGSSGGSSVRPSIESTSNPDYSYILAGGLNLSSVDTYKKTMEGYLSQIRGTSNVNKILGGLPVNGLSVGYIIDLTHNKYMRFILQEFDDTVEASYENITIPGRSAEVSSYNYTQGKSIPVSMELMAGTGFYTGSDPTTALHKDISFLQSLVYPDYSASLVNPPPVVLAYLGPSTSIKGVVTNVSVKYLKPYTTTGIPMRAQIVVTIKQSTEYPPDYKDILNKTSASY